MTQPHKTPKISVCMATHNGERFIRQQLVSILSQLDPDDEIVISDDSSIDGTIGIIKDFNDLRIRLYENNTFFNPMFNFENALKHATGDILVLSDQDDIWLDNKVAVIRKSFSARSDNMFLIVMDGFVVDDKDNVIYDSIFTKIKAGKGVVKNIYDNTFLGCSIAFSRELLEVALPFPKNIRMHDMWLGILCNILGDVEFVKEKTIRYRKHAASFTDFKREFKPLLQIKRRWFLACHLFIRTITYTMRAQSGK